MDILITIAQFILALSLLVTLHEWGHFFFARLFKTRVEKFYLFFDFLFPFSNILPFALWKKKKGDTEYGIGWFPLGGYVKIAGMVDESMDKDQLAKPPQPWEFRSKKAWQRLLIMMGGIIVNVLLALIIFAGIAYAWGTEKLPMSEVNKNGGIVVMDSIGYKAGFQDGDKILAIDGQSVQYFNNLNVDFITAKSVTISRNNEEKVITLPVDLIGQLVDANRQSPIFSFGIPVVVSEVVKGGFADKAGLQLGDQILSAEGIHTPNLREFQSVLKQHKNDSVHLSILRNGGTQQITAQVSNEGTLGFKPGYPSTKDEYATFGYQLEVQRYTLLQSIPAGWHMAGDKLSSYVKQMKSIINPKTGGYKGVGGFVSMAKVYGPEWDWLRFWTITATLSLILAFMNFLPIPGLDGGYVLFTLWEMVTGKKPNDRFLEIATTIGLVFLLFLMVYANLNDVIRNFFK